MIKKMCLTPRYYGWMLYFILASSSTSVSITISGVSVVTAGTPPKDIHGETTKRQQPNSTTEASETTTTLSAGQTVVSWPVQDLSTHNSTVSFDCNTKPNTLKYDSDNFETKETAKPAYDISEHKSDNVINNILFVFELILVPIIAITGVICNILSICVFRKQGKISANTKLLLGLTIADLLFLIFNLEIWAMRLVKKYNYPSFVKLMSSLRFDWNVSFVILSCGRSSNMLVAVLSVERFIAVKFPFSAKTSPLSRYPVQVTIGVWAFVTALLLPNLFRREHIARIDPASNQTIHVEISSDFAVGNPQFYIIYTYIILAVLRFIPVLLVILFNIAIIVTLKRTSMTPVTNQQAADNRQLREVKLTRMLIAISLIFLVCISPGFIHSLMANFLPGYFSSRSGKIVYAIFPNFDLVNSTINFFVYVVMSKNFRDTFLAWFLTCRSPMVQSPNTTQTFTLSTL